jgi:hypothetical protein
MALFRYSVGSRVGRGRGGSAARSAAYIARGCYRDGRNWRAARLFEDRRGFGLHRSRRSAWRAPGGALQRALRSGARTGLIVMEKISRRAHPRVQNFIRGHFKIGTNYTCEAIAQLLERFDLGWGRQFRAFVRARDDLVEALRSAYDLRNSIAHGGIGSRGLRGVQDLLCRGQTGGGRHGGGDHLGCALGH